MSGGARSSDITSRHVLIGIVAFFVVVFIANAVLLYFALATHAGIETPDAYRRGLAYNERVYAEGEQVARGWVDVISYDRTGGQLLVLINNRHATPIGGLRILAVVGRPATSRFDIRGQLSEMEAGRYVLETGQLEPGSWMVSFEASEVTAKGEKVVFRSKRRLWLTP